MTQIAVNKPITIESLSGWQFFMALATGRYQPGSAWRNPAYRAKFMLRSLGSPILSRKLLAWLVQLPHRDLILAAQPGLPCRLHRPYIAANFDHNIALNGLCFHYRTLLQSLPVSVLNQHLSPCGTTLASLIGKEESQYKIHLSAIANLDKEGEATLVISNESNTVLAELTFTLCPYQGKPVLFIGGLQGAKVSVPHQAIQEATKGCHGLFPKRILLEVACLLAQHFRVNQILAVSNQTHIYQTPRYYKKKKEKLHADYNAFWQSMSGELQPDGYFNMPLQIPRKPLEEIASKKRAEYRRRYILLDEMVEQITQRLECR